MTGSVSEIQETSRPLGGIATGRILFQGTFSFFDFYWHVILIWLKISRPSRDSENFFYYLKIGLLVEFDLYNHRLVVSVLRLI